MSKIAKMHFCRLFFVTLVAVFALTAGLARADEPAPWIEIRVGNVADGDRGEHDVILMAINGSMDFRDRSVHELPPGRHHFRIASTRRGPGGAMVARPFVIEARPCVRYALVADYGSEGRDQGWRIVVREETPIKACVKKFGPPPASAVDTASAAS
jgi:hypothetical protein